MKSQVVLWTLIVSCVAQGARADDKKPAAKADKAAPTSTISMETWKAARTASLTSAEIDRLMTAEWKKNGVEPAPLTSDEQFLRRVWLDLTGRLPMPADVQEFVADKAPDKRARAIEKLLETEEYGQRWGTYWTEVFNSRVENIFSRLVAPSFQTWMASEFKKNANWADITRSILTARGRASIDGNEENGQVYFMTSRVGVDAMAGAVELAGESSRVFLGIQIQCAQCHDHPFDVWKREQFHELAAYFARTRSGRQERTVGQVSLPRGDYRMAGKKDPSQFTIIQPRFLDGKAPKPGLDDGERRASLAESIVSKDNPYFAAAYVNRIWGELFGQSFYMPVDDLGPQKEAVMPEVIARLAGGFRGSNYNVKELFRVIMNSQTYQRQARPGASPDAHLLFAAINPRRVDADTFWLNLQDVLGPLDPQRNPKMQSGPAMFQTIQAQFKQEFFVDPSSRVEEVEGNLSQILFLMNSPQIHQRTKATGTNLLARILQSYPGDDEALRMVYLRAMSRRPTEREQEGFRRYLKSAHSRAEAYEDILWALLNSTEFQTKR